MISRLLSWKRTLFNSFLPAIVWWCAVLVLMCLPGRDFPSLGSWTELISLDKIIHVTVFGFMVFLFNRPFLHKSMEVSEKRQLYLRIALACALWGLTIEFIQHFWIPGRSMDLLDFVADTAGCMLAYRVSRKYLV